MDLCYDLRLVWEKWNLGRFCGRRCKKCRYLIGSAREMQKWESLIGSAAGMKKCGSLTGSVDRG